MKGIVSHIPDILLTQPSQTSYTFQPIILHIPANHLTHCPLTSSLPLPPSPPSPPSQEVVSSCDGIGAVSGRGGIYRRQQYLIDHQDPWWLLDRPPGPLLDCQDPWRDPWRLLAPGPLLDCQEPWLDAWRLLDGPPGPL